MAHRRRWGCSTVSDAEEQLVERVKKNAALWVAIGLFGVIALVFALIAAHTALSLWVGPVYEPLIIAAASTFAAAAIYLVSHLIAEIAHRREVQRRRSAETTALVTTAAVTALPILMKSPLMKQIGLPIGGALAAGGRAQRQIRMVDGRIEA